ncbi:hypothetical protein Glove_120g193 [Diversispora epigaea]|uniref:Uncharacterized protein n=1 Tax=Diversispora epigaea TaxID=1348612 RepID=A0A397IZH8_9GLOM|nr:hypothetical protein Glove_120g193 [Diversispora epigaea]
MLIWINGGVEEGIAIDRYANPREVRIYTFNANTNKVEWQTLTNPTHVAHVLTEYEKDLLVKNVSSRQIKLENFFR